MGLPEEDFPPFPKGEGAKTFKLTQGVFRDMLKRTAYAISTDESRYVLNGVLLSFKENKLSLVATDGRRLALVEQDIEFPKGSEVEAILPTKAVQELPASCATRSRSPSASRKTRSRSISATPSFTRS